MMRSLRQIVAVLLVAAPVASVLGTGIAHAADPFYANKTITFIIPGPPGGGPDLSCRLLMEYLPDHIAGHPTIIAKNMPGAASIIAVNYFGKEAKKDGSVVLCGVTAPANQLLKEPALQVDITKFDYVLGEGSPYAFYIRTDVAPGMKTPDDVFKAQGLVMGGSQPSSGHDIGARLFLRMLGLKYRYVTGMPGDTPGRAAMQQKFINIFMETTTGYTQVTVPSMVKDGTVLPLFQSGIPDQDGKLTLRDPLLPNLPTFREFYQHHFGKPAAGLDMDLADRQVGLIADALSTVALPSGAPKAASDALHAAVDPLNKDQDFLAAAAKLRGPGAHELPGSTVTKLTDAYLHMPPDVLGRLNDLINTGSENETK